MLRSFARRTCRRTACYNAKSNHITTSSYHPTEFTSTTLEAMRNNQVDIRLSHTPNARTPTTAHVPHVPPCRVPPAPLDVRRSDKTSPNDQDHAHACANLAPTRLRYIGHAACRVALCRLPFTLRPPALSTYHTCATRTLCASACKLVPDQTCPVMHRYPPELRCMHRYAPEPELAGRGQS